MGRVGDAPHYYDKANGLQSPLVNAVGFIEIYTQVAQLAQHEVIIGADLHHFNVLGLWNMPNQSGTGANTGPGTMNDCSTSCVSIFQKGVAYASSLPS